jgi:CBS domain-containing membrane protein
VRASRVQRGNEVGAPLADLCGMPRVLVSHIMSTKVVTFFAEQTLPLAEDVMRIHKFRHLPVIDNNRRLLGLVTDRDVLRSQIERRARQDDVRISALMTTDVWTVAPDALASHAGQTLLDHKYSCLPVVAHDGTLVGIVTERDFLRFAVKALQTHD